MSGIPSTSVSYVSKRHWYGFDGLQVTPTKVVDPNSAITIEELIVDTKDETFLTPTIDSDGNLVIDFTAPDNYTGLVIWHGDYTIPYELDTAALVEGDRFVFDTAIDSFFDVLLYEIKGGVIVVAGTDTAIVPTGTNFTCLSANRTPVYVYEQEFKIGETTEVVIVPQTYNADPESGDYDWG